MKIHFDVEGGFAGLAKHLDTDLNHLPPKQRKAIRKLIGERTRYEKLPSFPQARDIRKYNVRIESENNLYSFSFNDLNLPEEFLEFIYYMKEHAEL
jgi:DNA segregation ATPase FtsK/SpoIIIE-like protein